MTKEKVNMKKFFALAATIIIGACTATSLFAIDYGTVSTRVLETVTDDKIFIGQCANEKELALVLEKGYKALFDATMEDPDTTVEKIIRSMESKKEYDTAFKKAENRQKIADVYDYSHMDFTYDEILEIINTFKVKLNKESARYYAAIMCDSDYYAYTFVYDAKTKKLCMNYGYHYSYDEDDYYDDGDDYYDDEYDYYDDYYGR